MNDDTEGEGAGGFRDRQAYIFIMSKHCERGSCPRVFLCCILVDFCRVDFVCCCSSDYDVH